MKSAGVGHFQFGLLSLISLTAVVAAVLALLQPMDFPLWLHLGLVAYAILFAGYVILRGVHRVRYSLALRRQAKANREQLEAWIEQERAEQTTTKPDDPAL